MIRELAGLGQIGTLSISRCNSITAKISKAFGHLESVDALWLWCDVTRTAMRHIFTIPELTTLDVLEICRPGHLQCMESATALTTFRANHYMSEQDLLAVSKLPMLEELGAQNSEISPVALAALLEMPNLRRIDLEGSAFDDDMGAAVAQADQITNLEIGATRITGKGLKAICGMKQLRFLDLWANDIAEEDLDMLADLPNLEYLSVGGYEDQTTLTSEGVLPRLNRISSLRHIWLDGIPVSETEMEELEQRYDRVQL